MASNADAAAPSGDAARTVTRKFPRDAVVVINVLRSMVEYPRFPIGIPRTELSYRACSLARPGRHTSLTAASPSPSSR
jgi:hypothetical protein